MMTDEPQLPFEAPERPQTPEPPVPLSVPAHTLHRASDPSGSAAGAIAAVSRWGPVTVKRELLRAYADAYPEQLTDAEAAKLIRAPNGAWKRCAELRRLGVIAPGGTRLDTATGVNVMTCGITPLGVRALDQLQISHTLSWQLHCDE